VTVVLSAENEVTIVGDFHLFLLTT